MESTARRPSVTAALNRGVALILSPDRAYDEVPGLDRLDPAAPDALERLAG